MSLLSTGPQPLQPVSYHGNQVLFTCPPTITPDQRSRRYFYTTLAVSDVWLHSQLCHCCCCCCYILHVSPAVTQQPEPGRKAYIICTVPLDLSSSYPLAHTGQHAHRRCTTGGQGRQWRRHERHSRWTASPYKMRVCISVKS